MGGKGLNKAIKKAKSDWQACMKAQRVRLGPDLAYQHEKKGWAFLLWKSFPSQALLAKEIK